MNSKFKVIIFTFAVVIFFSATGCTGGNGQTLNSAEALKEYLDKQPANSPDKPIRLTMAANAPMLEKIAAAISSAGKYVSLNLSGNVLTTIPDGAFANCTLLTAINIPDSVTSIGGLAFAGCTGLTSVTMPNSVDEILGVMFLRTGLLNLPLPKGADTSGSGGGKIFYYSKAGFTMTDNNHVCHYLEAAPDNMTTKLAWASSRYTSANISGTKTGIGTGRKNTAVILATDAAAPAAKACKEYNYGGKTDWFLPSLDELFYLEMCRDYIGGLSYDWYWSSSQSGKYDIYAMDKRFGDGYQNNYDKGRTASVRAIRAF